MAKRKHAKLKPEKKEPEKKKIVEDGANLENLIPIDWKIPVSFLAGVVLTILYFTLFTGTSGTSNTNTGGNTLPGNTVLSDAHVNLIVLTDNACTVCDYSWIPIRVRMDYSNVTISYVDVSSTQGQSYVSSLGITSVPTAFFDSSVVNAANFSTYTQNNWLIPSGTYYLLNIQGEKDLTRTPSATPKIDLFVMSHCPYGTAAETTMNNMLNTVSGFDFNVHFIGTVYNESDVPANVLSNLDQYGLIRKNDSKYYSTLHGTTELDGDIAQLCAMKYYPATWWNFTLAYNTANFNLASAIATLGYNSSLIMNCVNSPEGWNLFAEDVQIAEELGISSSPTYMFDNTIRPQQSIQTYGPAGVLCTLHSTLNGCANIDQIQTATATGSC
ncbi:Uncharacterised protein [Candidatus Tiddalikarchaeum anstoanum]|nr:Uncharacterised protein [Candidatus Tiddalikarchaeum anstoanum]